MMEEKRAVEVRIPKYSKDLRVLKCWLPQWKGGVWRIVMLMYGGGIR
jgi:hypothetical protein